LSFKDIILSAQINRHKVKNDAKNRKYLLKILIKLPDFFI